MKNLVLNFLKSIRDYREQQIQINATVRELSSLTDRELQDIGISRGMIRTVAHQCIENENLKGWV